MSDEMVRRILESDLMMYKLGYHKDDLYNEKRVAELEASLRAIGEIVKKALDSKPEEE